MSVLVSGHLKTSLVEIASAVERMVLPVDPNFEKDQTNNAYFNNSWYAYSQSIFPEDREQLQLFTAFWVVRHNWLRQAGTCRLKIIWQWSLFQWWLCGIFTNCSVESRGCPCIYSQSAAFHEIKTDEERSTTISGLFLRVEVQTEVAYLRQDGV